MCLRKDDYPEAHVVHTSEHVVAVDAGPFRFIALYVPCGEDIQHTDYVLEWIPPHHEHLLITGDWNKLATNNEWLALLQYKGLHICPLPMDFTRIGPDGSTSILDNAASTNAAITKLTAWPLSDHLALNISFGPEKSLAKKFPIKILDDSVYQREAQYCAQMWSKIMDTLSSPQDLCLTWDGLKSILVILAHKRFKEVSYE